LIKSFLFFFFFSYTEPASHPRTRWLLSLSSCVGFIGSAVGESLGTGISVAWSRAYQWHRFCTNEETQTFFCAHPFPRDRPPFLTRDITTDLGFRASSFSLFTCTLARAIGVALGNGTVINSTRVKIILTSLPWDQHGRLPILQ